MQDPSGDRRFRVGKAYQRSTAEPLVLRKGDRVRIGRPYEDDPEWPDWIWCEDTAGKGGWVPKQLIAAENTRGSVRDAYEARQISVQEGEIVTVSSVLNGWAWARRCTGESGWLPLRHLIPCNEAES
jgi:hypothetical protein